MKVNGQDVNNEEGHQYQLAQTEKKMIVINLET